MSEIYPWHAQPWQQVVNAARTTGSHAFLLHGPEGLGKVAFAKRLAAWMLCGSLDKNNLTQACGECASCQLFDGGAHPDLINLTIADKKQFISVDQVRALIEKVTHTALRAGCQVVVIYPADKLNRSAANALLKTLEEPNGQVKFILASNSLSKLAATVVSRCQLVRFQPVWDEASCNWLQHKLPADVDAKRMLSLANNAPLLAIKLVENDYLKLMKCWFDCLCKTAREAADPVPWVEDLIKFEPGFIMRSGMSLVVDMIRIKMNLSVQSSDKPQYRQRLSELVAAVSLASLFKFFDLLQQQSAVLLGDIKANAQLLLESLLIDWISITAHRG